MQKRLVQVGTSLALVIDKTVLKLWNVTRMSRLSVELEGGRLVIAPVVGDGDPRPQSRREALQVLEELRKLGFKQGHFDRIAAVPMRLGAYVTQLDRPREATPDIAVTMCRLAELRRLLRQGWNQRSAFASAIASHPYELPSGVETRLGDDEAQEGAEKAVMNALAEIELARREARFMEEQREAQRLAQEAWDRDAGAE